MLFSNLVAAWQETFADAGDGDGAGTIWDHFRKKLRPFQDPLCPRNLFFNQKYISLKWHIITSSPLFEQHYNKTPNLH